MMQWDEASFVRICGRTCGQSVNGVRFSMAKHNHTVGGLCKVRLGVDVLAAMRWVAGDNIAIRWSRQAREFNFYRTNTKKEGNAYSLKMNSKRFQSSGYIEYNPRIFVEKDADIVRILRGLCEACAEPSWRPSSDGLIVSMVSD